MPNVRPRDKTVQGRVLKMRVKLRNKMRKLYVTFLLPEGGQTTTEVKLKNRFVERYIDDYKMLTVEIVKPNYMSICEWLNMKKREVK